MADYTLRQTRPEQVTTHWDTCYTLHSACMERKVETMTQAIQAAEKLGAYTALKLTQQLEVNVALMKAGEALYVELEDAAHGYEGVHWKVQRDAPPVLAAWRAVVEGKEGKEA